MKGIRRGMSLLLIMALTLWMLPALAATDMPVIQGTIELSDYFSKRDLSGEWDEKDAVAIRWENGAALCESDEVTVSGENVTITTPGVYVLSGTAQDATVTVDASSEDKVQLVLNGVSLTSADSAAILIENADKAFITLAEGTENTLANGGAFDGSSDVDAVIFSRDDLTLNGTGSLTVVSPAGHGIVGKDDLKIASGTYTITAANRGIDANDSLRIADGDFTIESGKDALRAKEDEEGKGWVLLFGGSYDLTVGGGAANAPAHREEWGWGRRQRETPAVETTTESRKGIKSSGNLIVLGGTYAINAADDALHANADLWIADGTLIISTGDDGIHADDSLLISGGEIDIRQSYEGIEATAITVSGGSVSLTASDDGLNAAGGNDESGFGWNDMFTSDGVSSITISGGEVHVNASGDGIDSNGDLFVTGGSVVVSGPTNSGNGALDYNGSASITGGTVIAAGAVGMAQSFGSGSSQVSFLVNLSGGAGSEITVTDQSGRVILSGTVEKQFTCVVISSPELQVGESYTVSSGTSSATVNITSVSSGSGGFGGGFGPSGGGPGGGGRR